MKLKLTLLFLSISLCGFAQDVSLDETVKYLNNKIISAQGHYREISQNGKNLRCVFSDLSFEKDEKDFEQVIIKFYRTYNPDDLFCNGRNTHYFNPAHILSMRLLPKNMSQSPVEYVEITLKGKTGISITKFDGFDDCYEKNTHESVETITFPFLASDGTNFEKIKKALLHLKKLYAAQDADDPFANK